MTPPSDVLVYGVGDLPKSGSGYEWRSDVEPAGPQPRGDGDAGPWLVPADPPVLSFGHRPPWGRGLLRRFAGLRRPEDMAGFAGDYGLLGEPVTLKMPDGRWVGGEPLQLWQREVDTVGELARALDEAAKATEDVRFLPALAGRFSLQPVVGGQPELTFTYGRASMPVTFGMTGVRHKPADLVDAWQRVKKLPTQRDIAELAERVRGCAQWAIESRLQGQHVGIRYGDYRRPGSQPPQIIPATLLGAIYLQLDRKVRTMPRHRSARPLVACAWGPCPNWVEPVRQQERYYCGNTCRQRAKRHRDNEQAALLEGKA